MSLLRSYPVMPIGGFVWQIDGAWTLEACFPNPRIIWKASNELEIWAGGELSGGAFRRNESTDPRLNATTLTYSEVRAGAGFNYAGWKWVTVGFGAGWVFDRKFDLHRVHETYSTQGAPYVQILVTLPY